MGNSILSTVLQGCSAIDVLVSLSERVHAADSDVAQLTLVLDSAQEALANSEKALQERQQRPAETPPASPAAARKELIGLDQEKAAALGVEVVEAQYEVEQQQERAAELEGRLAAFEAASEREYPVVFECYEPR